MLLADSDRPQHIKGEHKLPATLCLKIVGHRAYKTALIVILLVGNLLIKIIIVSALELQIWEVNQDDDSTLVTHIFICLTSPTALKALDALGINLLATYLGAPGNLLLIDLCLELLTTLKCVSGSIC